MLAVPELTRAPLPNIRRLARFVGIERPEDVPPEKLVRLTVAEMRRKQVDDFLWLHAQRNGGRR